MNEYCVGLLQGLMRSGLALSIAAVVVLLFLRLVSVASANVRRTLWFAVVLQGCLLVRIPVNVPAIPFLTTIISQDVPSQPEMELSFDKSTLRDGLILVTDGVTSESIVAPRMMSLRGFPWAMMLVCIWSIGMAVMIGRSVWYYVRFIRALPAATKAPDEWVEEWNSLQRHAGLRRSVTLYPTSNLGPLLCWHPRGYQLIVPADVWRLLEPRQRIMILRHELAHIQRGDIWKSCLLRLLALPHWFNPLAWWAVKRFDDDAESACDDAICRASPMDAIEYARTLLLFGQSHEATFLVSQAVGGHGLADRIRRLVAPNSRKDSNMKKMLIVTAVLGISALHLLRFQSLAEDQAKKAEAPVQTSGNVVTLTNLTGIELSEGIHSDQGNFKGDFIGIFVDTKTPVPRTEAVVDVRSLFVSLLEYREGAAELKALIAKSEATAKEKQAEIQQLQLAELKAARVDSDDRGRKQIEAANAAFDAWRRASSQEFLRMEAEIYVKVLKNINAEVAQYAKQNGIRVVRKLDRSSGTSVGNLSGVVVNVSGAASAHVSGDATLTVGNNADSIVSNNTIIFTSGIAGAPGTPGIRVKTGEAGASITAEQITIGTTSIKEVQGGPVISLTLGTPANAAPNDKSSDKKVPPATGLSFINIGTTSVDGKGTLVLNSAPNPDDVIEQMKQQMRQLSQKEVLYAEPGDDFDITQEILKRMNAKFEQEQAAKKAK